MARVLLAAALLAIPASAYVAPRAGAASPESVQLPASQVQLEQLDLEEPSQTEGVFSILTAGFGVGAVLGWLNSRKQQIASVAAASAVAMAPAANAMVDYDNIQYLGGSDKVDINNANIQAPLRRMDLEELEAAYWPVKYEQFDVVYINRYYNIYIYVIHTHIYIYIFIFFWLIFLARRAELVELKVTGDVLSWTFIIYTGADLELNQDIINLAVRLKHAKTSTLVYFGRSLVHVFLAMCN